MCVRIRHNYTIRYYDNNLIVTVDRIKGLVAAEGRRLKRVFESHHSSLYDAGRRRRRRHFQVRGHFVQVDKKIIAFPGLPTSHYAEAKALPPLKDTFQGEREREQTFPNLSHMFFF